MWESLKKVREHLIEGIKRVYEETRNRGKNIIVYRVDLRERK